MAGRNRRALRTTAVLLLVAAFFVFGFLSGRAGRPTPAVSVLDEAASRIRAGATSEVDEAALTRGAIEGMLATLGDRYASYYEAADYEQFQRMLDGRYTGVGVWLRRDPAGRIHVVSVLPDSPADDAGIDIGDEVTSVAGRRVSGDSVSQVVQAMRGSAGTAVRVGVRRDGRAVALTLRRSDAPLPDVTVDRPAPDVARIRVAAFTRGVGRDVRAAVERARAERVSGIVLDLRGNPGGLLHEGVEVASAFLDGGKVVAYSARGVAPRRFDAIGRGDATTSLVVLVDGGTASAAEVVAGALQDRSRAVVIGARTYGKGSVQQPIRLSDGSAIEITVARYVTAGGRSLDGVGITPDVEVLSTLDGAVALRRAVEVLAGIVADAAPRG